MTNLCPMCRRLMNTRVRAFSGVEICVDCSIDQQCGVTPEQAALVRQYPVELLAAAVELLTQGETTRRKGAQRADAA